MVGLHILRTEKCRFDAQSLLSSELLQCNHRRNTKTTSMILTRFSACNMISGIQRRFCYFRFDFKVSSSNTLKLKTKLWSFWRIYYKSCTQSLVCPPRFRSCRLCYDIWFGCRSAYLPTSLTTTSTASWEDACAAASHNKQLGGGDSLGGWMLIFEGVL